MLRELRRDELTLKDMSTLREGDSAKSQFKKPYAQIRDYSLQHTLGMSWKLDEKNRGLRPFRFHIDDRSFILSWAELKEMDEAGFFRREKGNPSSYRLRFYDGPKLTFDTALNEEAERDMIFRISGEGIEAFCDWYQMMRAGRFI